MGHSRITLSETDCSLPSRIPGYADMQKGMHSLHIQNYAVAQPRHFDAAMEAFKSLLPQDMIRIRQKGVSERIRSLCIAPADLLDQGPSAESYFRLIARSKDVVKKEVIVVEYDENGSCSPFIEQYIRQHWKKRFSNVRDKYIQTAKKWSEDEYVHFLSRVIARVLALSSDKGPKYSVDVFFNTCEETMNFVREHFCGNTYVAQHLLRSIRGFDGKKVAFALDEPPQTRRDKSKIRGLAAKNEYELRAEVLQTVRQSTDSIRTEIIPALVRSGATCKQAFWAIHAAHFRDPFNAHLHTDSRACDVKGYVSAKGGAAFYAHNIGKVRTINVRSSSNGDICGYHINHEYLVALGEDFFHALENALQTVKNDSDFLDLVTAADMFLISAHLPFDGSGRTIEDFLVYVSQRAGKPLTISQSGYRHETSNLVYDHMCNDNAYKQQRDVLCLQNFGIQVKNAVEHEKWGAYLGNVLRTNFGSQGEALLHSAYALEAARITNALGNPQEMNALKKRYAVFQRLRRNWYLARKQKYVVAADEKVAKMCDLAIAGRHFSPDFMRECEIWNVLHTLYIDDPLVNHIKQWEELSLTDN